MEKSNKELEFKELGAEHLFLFCDVIDAIGIEEFAKSYAGGNAESENESASVGFKMAAVIVRGLKQAKTQIYKFFESCTNYTYEEISHMKLVPFTRMIKEFTKKEELGDFLEEVKSFLPMEK